MLVHSEENNQEVLVQCEEEVGMKFKFSSFSQRHFFVISKKFSRMINYKKRFPNREQKGKRSC